MVAEQDTRVLVIGGRYVGVHTVTNVGTIGHIDYGTTQALEVMLCDYVDTPINIMKPKKNKPHYRQIGRNKYGHKY